MKVRIYSPHTHQRVAHVPGPEGRVLEVSAPEAAFLKRLGLLEPPSGAEPQDAPLQTDAPPSSTSDA